MDKINKGCFCVNQGGFTYWSATGKPTNEGAGSTGERPVLTVFNSIGNKMDKFEPHSKDRMTVNWYMCGPTVYDHSHMGHAKTYVCFDILRRIMTDYFKYDVRLCMNITDIDDKIIIRCNEQKVDFKKHARKFENEFFQDCEALNIRLPTVVTRVSEYVPEIVAFIEKIIANGFAYESNGSVYFSVKKFEADPKHEYAKLEPSNKKNWDLIKEGEGALGEEAAKDKRDERDFALWKKSKVGEPFWESPWGTGRPGWHIECSAMAGEIFDWPIDVHSGGCDLKFPHHDNELAQSEAFYGCDNWINHFWHTGHLHIDGLKMSKSLKNFTTIKEMLKIYTAKQVRFLFLIHKWNQKMNYSPDDSFQEAIVKEKQFDEFFKNVKANLRNWGIKETTQAWNEKDKALDQLLHDKQAAVRAALSDDFDTPQAIQELFELVGQTNKYINQPASEIKVPLVRQVSRFVFDILKCFGIYESGDFPMVSGLADGAASNGKSHEDTIAPLMEALIKFRDDVKNPANQDPKALFKLSDELRDDILPFLGIRLEDKKDQPTIWKYENPDILIKERENKLAEKEKKAAEKLAKAELALKKKSTSGKDWFRVMESEKYSKFDEETGLPTHDAKGKAINDTVLKGLKKLQTKQQGNYEKWLKEQEKN